MAIDEEVINIVSNALKDLPENLRNFVMNNNYFITKVRGTTYKVSSTGQMIPQNYVIINFERQGVPEDIETYNRESLELYDMFQDIKKWYPC